MSRSLYEKKQKSNKIVFIVSITIVILLSSFTAIGYLKFNDTRTIYIKFTPNLIDYEIYSITLENNEDIELTETSIVTEKLDITLLFEGLNDKNTIGWNNLSSYFFKKILIPMTITDLSLIIVEYNRTTDIYHSMTKNIILEHKIMTIYIKDINIMFGDININIVKINPLLEFFKYL
jgi:hypothetical protein